MWEEKKSPDQKKSDQIAEKVDALLSEGYQMWERFGFRKLTEEERYLVAGCAADACKKREFAEDYAAACQSFFLFRKLHEWTEEFPETATLLGDYFFSRFSHYLIPIDSTRLIDLFSEYLKADTKEMFEKDGKAAFCMERYLDFVRKTAGEIAL
ncbi:MAG: hypothetical protein V8R80_02480 [Eubacterium sp.]